MFLHYIYSFSVFFIITQFSIYAEKHTVSSRNDITLRSYETAIREYIHGTPNQVTGEFKEWIDATLRYLNVDARILEIGSAFGRDAGYIESCGFKVECTDAVESFVQLLQQKGFSGSLFNVLTDDFSTTYDLIFANAVFLHFTQEELKAVMIKMKKGLSDKGILSFSLKIGEGEEWTTEKLNNPRYFCYWNTQLVLTLMNETGYEVLYAKENDRFLHIIACSKNKN